jgi:hypothetical protein
MKRLPLLLLAGSLALALLPATAAAKGPIEASIDGPGLHEPLRIGDEDEWSGRELAAGSPLMRLAESLGFFPAAFGAANASQMLPGRPKGVLGPRYLVTYVVPGPEGVEDVLRQDLYPYAAAGLVSYMPQGQRFFGSRETAGGWFVAPTNFKSELVAAGLPARPPADGDGNDFPWTAVGALAALGAALAVGVGAVLLRRRPHPAV